MAEDKTRKKVYYPCLGEAPQVLPVMISDQEYQALTSQRSPALLSFEVLTVIWMYGHAVSQVKVSSQD